jgi:hypothetical protein
MRKDKEIDQKRSKGFLVFFDSIFTKRLLCCAEKNLSVEFDECRKD